MSDELVKVSAPLAQVEEVELPLTVGMLESRLRARFPKTDGEPWDVYGCVIGDADIAVSKVTLALDPTIDAVRRTAEAGAQVLITHHPVFLQAPEKIAPAGQVAGPGAVLWEAAKLGVAIMSFHTALDAQPEATTILPEMLSLQAGRVFEPTVVPEKGYGRVCTPAKGDSLTLGQLASRCLSVFGRAPRVWGDSSAALQRVVTWAGSFSSADALFAEGAQVLVCGEVKYHCALDLSQAGIGVIELGHDVSELPYALLLVKAVEACGISRECITLLDRGPHWDSPDAVRL